MDGGHDAGGDEAGSRICLGIFLAANAPPAVVVHAAGGGEDGGGGDNDNDNEEEDEQDNEEGDGKPGIKDPASRRYQQRQVVKDGIGSATETMASIKDERCMYLLRYSLLPKQQRVINNDTRHNPLTTLSLIHSLTRALAQPTMSLVVLGAGSWELGAMRAMMPLMDVADGQAKAKAGRIKRTLEPKLCRSGVQVPKVDKVPTKAFSPRTSTGRYMYPLALANHCAGYLPFSNRWVKVERYRGDANHIINGIIIQLIYEST
ncbi:hypothetical protein CHU98_g1888 [Xylaria longipes]|nr:hypothetical protein CHU98_g1888 [Xylaria longipes]